MYLNLTGHAIGVSLPFEEIVPLAAKYDFEAVDLGPGMFDDEWTPERVKNYLSEYDLRPGPVGLPVDFRSDEKTFLDTLESFRPSIPLLREAGATRVLTWLFPYSDTVPYEENFEIHRERLGQCARLLEEHGMRLGLEFVAPKTFREGHTYEFIHNLQQMMDLCKAIGTSNIGILLDSWHWYTSHGNLMQLELLTDQQIVGVHINDAPEGVNIDEQVDNVRRLPGETGVIDLTGFLKTLKKIQYSGPVAAEPFSEKVKQLPPEEAVKTTSQAFRKIWEQAGFSWK